MKSKTYKLNGKLFRYNFATCTVEYIPKADKETLTEEAEWKLAHEGRSLYGVGDDGYIVLDTIGLHPDNWKDREPGPAGRLPSDTWYRRPDCRLRFSAYPVH